MHYILNDTTLLLLYRTLREISNYNQKQKLNLNFSDAKVNFDGFGIIYLHVGRQFWSESLKTLKSVSVGGGGGFMSIHE